MVNVILSMNISGSSQIHLVIFGENVDDPLEYRPVKSGCRLLDDNMSN